MSDAYGLAGYALFGFFSYLSLRIFARIHVPMPVDMDRTWKTFSLAPAILHVM